MINFIIEEKSKIKREYYEMTILNFIGIREDKFKVYDYNKFKNKHSGINIYILSSNSFKHALNTAKEIREKDKFQSQIIIISNLNNVSKKDLINNLLILSYIDNNDNIKNKLKESLTKAYKISTEGKTLNIVINKEINKIPYNNILYIEKSNNQNYCNIYTKNNTLPIVNTIKKLESLLDSAYFLKTHRSAIVNVYNIDHYNSIENIIYFDKKEKYKTDLISRDKRNVLKSRLIEEKVK